MKLTLYKVRSDVSRPLCCIFRNPGKASKAHEQIDASLQSQDQLFPLDIHKIQPQAGSFTDQETTTLATLTRVANIPSKYASCSVFWTGSSVTLIGSSALVKMSLSEGRETLLLGNGVHICANKETDNVEERHPGMLRKEFLRKGEGQRRRNPADPHDRHETSLPCRMNLMDSLSSCNDSHRDQVDTVLDGGNLR